MAWDGEILVPFAAESSLSGVGRSVGAEQELWYERTFTVPAKWSGRRVLLHFGAVDQTATVWCNGVELATHTGGYLPFTVDITEVLAKENTILVCVRDATNKSQLPRGKQTLPARHLVHAAERHLADGLARERAAELHPLPARDAAV